MRKKKTAPKVGAVNEMSAEEKRCIRRHNRREKSSIWRLLYHAIDEIDITLIGLVERNFHIPVLFALFLVVAIAIYAVRW